MSIRTLIEINHDYSANLGDEFLAALQYYARTNHPSAAERLRDMGVYVIADRHHCDDYRIPDGAAGFVDKASA